MNTLVPTGSTNTAQLLGMFLTGRSPQTMRAYAADLRDFTAWLEADSPAAAVTHLLSRSPGDANALVLRYRNALLDDKLAPATVNRRVMALRSVVKLARTIGIITWTLDISGVPNEAYRDTRGPTHADYTEILEVLEERTAVPVTRTRALRDLAIVRLLHDLALRRSEVVSLDLAHVDLNESRLSVLGKGDRRRRWLTLPESTAATLARWIQARGPAPGPLFVSFDPARKGDGRLIDRSIGRIIEGVGRQIGITLRPHGLRHAAITRALDKSGGDIRAVQRFARHRKPETILRYDDNRQDLAGTMAALIADDDD